MHFRIAFGKRSITGSYYYSQISKSSRIDSQSLTSKLGNLSYPKDLRDPGRTTTYGSDYDSSASHSRYAEIGCWRGGRLLQQKECKKRVVIESSCSKRSRSC